MLSGSDGGSSNEMNIQETKTATGGVYDEKSPLVDSTLRFTEKSSKLDAQTLGEESSDRLARVPPDRSKAWLIPVTIGGALYNLAAIAGGFVLGLPMMAGEKIFGLSRDIADLRNQQRGFDWMGGMPSVLNSTIKVPKSEGTPNGERPLEAVLKDQLPGLGSSVALDEVKQYVKMGERIMLELAQAETDDNTPVTELRFKVDTERKKNMTVTVRPGMEVTRAISWYLQAKALFDNQGNRELTLLKEGAMIAKDPGNKLYNFLRSSDLAYGRVSSHMQERSDSYADGWRAPVSGFAATVGVDILDQPLQYGIEDFDNRMPSKGGTLLFDKLTSSNPNVDRHPEIYLKWESMGTPSSWEGERGDYLPGEALWNRGLAPFRTLGHSLSFLRNADPEGYRGEKMDKGPSRDVLDAFSKTVRDLPIPEDDKVKITSDAKKYGATYMWDTLGRMIQSNELRSTDQESLKKVKEQLNEWALSMGNPYLGIARKGAEVHVVLPGAMHDLINLDQDTVKPKEL
jgi:hypothetical protein